MIVENKFHPRAMDNLEATLAQEKFLCPTDISTLARAILWFPSGCIEFSNGGAVSWKHSEESKSISYTLTARAP